MFSHFPSGLLLFPYCSQKNDLIFTLKNNLNLKVFQGDVLI